MCLLVSLLNSSSLAIWVVSLIDWLLEQNLEADKEPRFGLMLIEMNESNK